MISSTNMTFTMATKSYYEENKLFHLKKQHYCSSETDCSGYIMWYKIRHAVQHDSFLESTNIRVAQYHILYKEQFYWNA